MTKPLTRPTNAATANPAAIASTCTGDPGNAFAARNIARQHEGDGQSGQIGGGDDRQVEPARQQGQHHRKREDAELRHLEGHRLQRVDGEEPIADGNREHRPERDQQQDEASAIVPLPARRAMRPRREMTGASLMGAPLRVRRSSPRPGRR